MQSTIRSVHEFKFTVGSELFSVSLNTQGIFSTFFFFFYFIEVFLKLEIFLDIEFN